MTIAQTAFIKKVASLITDRKILPSLTIAQAILESGWGQSGLTIKGNALFGIKAGLTWKGKRYSSKTQECYDKINFKTITAAFRGYNSWLESIQDHTAFIVSNKRYAKVLTAKDYKSACYAIAQAGYATSPTYAQSLVNIIEGYKLYEYDKVAAPVKPIAPASKPAVSSAKPIFKVGDKVSILKSVQYDGKPFKAWYKTYTVKEISGNRAVIGVGAIITCAINIANIKKI